MRTDVLRVTSIDAVLRRGARGWVGIGGFGCAGRSAGGIDQNSFQPVD